jgi:hypothetical protein
LYIKMPSFYQDRLGTNIGKALKKGRVSAGARLYGAGIQWQRDAALAMAKQQAQRKEDELKAVRSKPEINSRSKELAAKDGVRVKRVVHDLDTHQSKYLKTVEQKRDERAKTFKNAAVRAVSLVDPMAGIDCR